MNRSLRKTATKTLLRLALGLLSAVFQDPVAATAPAIRYPRPACTAGRPSPPTSLRSIASRAQVLGSP